ncbi:hypothetical protein BDV27DRAFT_133014 [Aspergillus caelatus]|uniref:Uncharacterized protein n=1 Tax=Aspergillus caelatus TaxID=61420 RepID=A0A5N6ZVA8_9EURO|nr:uncharacterized protein BDV27DRAFT_133014 [Aspergillus caelatus]KAE8361452.1 hypothetical protein BDV27DRAFT_133014 [Aspergillus caelatus]
MLSLTEINSDSGYSCGHAGHDQYQTCQSVYATGSFPVVQCRSGSSNGYTYQTVPATVTATTSKSVTLTHTISAYTVRAPMIQINHMATDLPTSTSTPPHPTSSDSSSGIEVSASISAHLSPGAKAGIIVAACLGAIGLLAFIAWLWYKCGSRRDKAASAKSETGDSQVPPIPVTNNSMSQEPQTNRPKSELPAHHNVSELDGSQISGHGNTAGPG